MDRRKILALILAVIAATVLGLFVWQMVRHSKEVSAIERMPSIVLKDLDGADFDTGSLSGTGRGTVIICFSPDCDFCGMESEEIVKNHKSLSGCNLLFVTPAQEDEVFSFLTDHPIDAIPGVKILMDLSGKFFRTFSVTAPPVCLIYDEQMRLSARHKGVISVDQIIDLMDNGQKNHK